LTTVGLAENSKKQDIGTVYFCEFVAILNQDVLTHFSLVPLGISDFIVLNVQVIGQ